jgi:Tfp pilus assembly protein PilF
VIDFIPSDAAAKQRAYPLSQRTIEAMYLNNRAGEALADNRVDDAYWWAKAAVVKDPGFMMAYNTLGVTFQKQGKIAQAEHVYKRALDRVPEDTVVMHNMVQVLKTLGKNEEAAAMTTRLASIEPHPPFYFFEKGLLAMNAGKVEEAKAFFARELRRSPYNHEFHFWLAMAHLRLGDARAARTELAAAINTSTTADATQRYSAKLDYLRSLAATPGSLIR